MEENFPWLQLDEFHGAKPITHSSALLTSKMEMEIFLNVKTPHTSGAMLIIPFVDLHIGLASTSNCYLSSCV
jgi:hypothetical protein